MNLKKMFGISLISLGTAFAQEYVDASADNGYSSNTTSSTTAPSMSEQELQKQEEQAAASNDLTAPVPFVAPDIPKESKRSSFNSILHGKSYNMNSNMAAANNTVLLLRYPNLFANRKFFYIEPTNEMGIVSLGSFFTAFDISKAPLDDSQLGRLTLGYAVPGFGFYLRAGLGRNRVSTDNGVQSTTNGGDDWAFAIAKGFMGYNLALEGDWLTKKNQVHSDPDNGPEVEQRYNSLSLNLNLTNAPTAKNFTWTAGVGFLNYLNEIEVDGDVDPASEPDSYWQIDPYVRGGVSVLENDNARVLIGFGGFLVYKHMDDPNDAFSITAILQPSMMGEVFIGEEKNFMFYGEAGYNWVVFSYNKDNETDVTAMVDQMYPVVASVGFRYQYKDFLAVELGLGDKLFTGAGNFFQADGTFIDFSAMIRF